MYITILALIFATSASLAQMALAPLSNDEIQSFLFGQTMSGEYSTGAKWAERFNADGSSNYSQFGRVTHGKMTLNGNILCFIYDDNNEGGCFEVWRHGSNCFSFYGAGSAASLDQRRFGRGWDARGWYENQPATCSGDQIS